MRHPVIRHAFENELHAMNRSAGSAISRKDGAHGAWKYNRSYTSSAINQVPAARQRARMASCSGWLSVQPVGLFGLLINTAATPGRIASMSRSRPSVHPLEPNRSGTETTSAPRILGISQRFGHTGVTATTGAPGSTIACSEIISADTPELVMAIRSAAIGRCQRER